MIRFFPYFIHGYFNEFLLKIYLDTNLSLLNDKNELNHKLHTMTYLKSHTGVSLGLMQAAGLQADLSDIDLLLNLFPGLRDTLPLIAAVGFQIENLSLKLI